MLLQSTVEEKVNDHYVVIETQAPYKKRGRSFYLAHPFYSQRTRSITGQSQDFAKIVWCWAANHLQLKFSFIPILSTIQCPEVHIFSNKKYVYKKHEAETRQKLRHIKETQAG